MLTCLKTQGKATPQPIQLQDFPADQRIHQLRPERKHFIDTIVAHLCEEPNDPKTHYPDSNLCLQYIPLRSAPFLPGQGV